MFGQVLEYLFVGGEWGRLTFHFYSILLFNSGNFKTFN